MFVTSSKVQPKFSSLAAADAQCAAAATAAGLPGSYRAWLSTTQIDARNRLTGARGWIRTDGTPFADTAEDVGEGRLFNPPLLDEYGHPHRGGVMDPVMTGTNAAGYLDPGMSCDDWTDDIAGTATAGVTEGTTELWTIFTTGTCGVPMRMYCFGVDGFFSVGPAAAPGKLAFVSDGHFAPVGGIAAADALCAAEAFAGGLTRNFKALMATSTSSPAARFPAGGTTDWVRLDGVPLNALGTSIFDGGPLLTPLNVTSRMAYVGNESVFVGARTANEIPTTESTCQDWQDPTFPTTVAGRASYVPWWLYDTDAVPCNLGSGRIYCLED